jgi:hypothetical protein
MLDLNLTDVQYAQETIARLRGDAALMATRADQVEKLAKAVGHARRQFIERVQLARELDARVDKASEGNRRPGATPRSTSARCACASGMRQDAHRRPDPGRTARGCGAQGLRQEGPEGADRGSHEADRSEGVRRQRDAAAARGAAAVPAAPGSRPRAAAEVQWMLDDLARVEEVPAAIGRLVKETLALGQVPVKKPARPTLAAAEAQKLIKTFGLPDDGSRRTKAAKILADDAIEAWPRELAKLYGGKESELKARLGEVRKLPFVRSIGVDRPLSRRVLAGACRDPRREATRRGPPSAATPACGR